MAHTHPQHTILRLELRLGLANIKILDAPECPKRERKHQDPGFSPMPKERERHRERERIANAEEESSETEGCGCGSANQGHVEFGDARLALRVHHQRCQNHGSPPLTLSRSACMRARVGCMCCVRERERERERERIPYTSRVRSKTLRKTSSSLLQPHLRLGLQIRPSQSLRSAADLGWVEDCCRVLAAKHVPWDRRMHLILPQLTQL